MSLDALDATPEREREREKQVFLIGEQTAVQVDEIDDSITINIEKDKEKNLPQRVLDEAANSDACGLPSIKGS